MSTAPTILCTPCLRADKNVNAIKYCVECNENFCRFCFRKHIKEFASISKQHRFLNRDEMPEWLSQPGEETNICTRHTNNQLDSYCEDHDLVCCGACVVIEHSLCKKVRDLIPISGETEPKSETDILLQDLTFMIDALKALQENRRLDQSNLRKSTAKSLSRVRDFRQKINDIFNELEKQAVEDIDTECIQKDNFIESDIKQTENSVTLLEMAIKQIRDFEKKTDGSAVETNTNILNGKRLLKDIKHVYKEIQDKNTHQVNFKVNEIFDKYISVLKNIGKCEMHAGRKPAIPVTVSKYTVDMEGGKANYDFQDVLQTEVGTVLLLDAERKCIKQLDESFRVTKTYDLVEKSLNEADALHLNEPFAICRITDNKIAVSMTRDKVVKLYDIKELCEMVREVDVGEYCRGIAYNTGNEEIFVACGGGSYTGEGLGHIRVYSLKGELLRSFKQSQDGRIISPRPVHLAMDNDGSKIFIADSVKGIIAVDGDGKVLSMFTAPELAGSRGLCVDVNDHVIVCGYSSNVILRIHDDMKAYDVLLTEANGIRNPLSLCYDATLSRCIVITNCLNEISVFDV